MSQGSAEVVKFYPYKIFSRPLDAGACFYFEEQRADTSLFICH